MAICQAKQQLAAPVPRVALVFVLEEPHVRLPVVLTGEQPADVDAKAFDELRKNVEVRLGGLIFDDATQLVRIHVELTSGYDQIAAEFSLQQAGDAGSQISS